MRTTPARPFVAATESGVWPQLLPGFTGIPASMRVFIMVSSSLRIASTRNLPLLEGGVLMRLRIPR